MSDIEARDALLLATMPHVLFDGWSPAALRAGARDLDLPDGAVDQTFPEGAGEAALWLDDWADRQMLATLAGMDLDGMKIRERIAAGVMARLDALAPHREAVRRAIARKFGPFGAAQTGRIIYRTVDAIWYAAGDRSVDFNFYTKRGLLAAAYGATVLFWLNDSSEGATATKDFLNRRLDNIMQIPKLKAKAESRLRPLLRPLEKLRKGVTRTVAG